MEKNQIVIIPVFNELNSLKKVIKKISKSWKILVIDDCSEDGTSKWLKKDRINYLKNKKNLGYEKSLIKGLKFALKEKKIKFICTIDGDGEHDPKYLEILKKKLVTKNYDMVIGERSNLNRFSEVVVGKIYKKKYGISDPLSGFKIYKANKLKLIIKKVKSYFFLVDIINLIIINFGKIGLIKINTKTRLSGRPKVGGNLFVNLKIFFLIILIFFY